MNTAKQIPTATIHHLPNAGEKQLTIEGVMELPDPLTPADADIRDFGDMPVDVSRVMNSKFSATVDPASGYYGMMLWFASWHRVPAASLPNDDRQLCHLAGLGRDINTWNQIKGDALYGWIECSDGNLYHPVIAEKALVAWLEKLHQRVRSGRGNASRWGCEFSEESELISKFHASWEMLKKANPSSKLILKGNPLENSKDKTKNPTGNPTGIDGGIHDQSQGKVREGKVSKEEDNNPLYPPGENPEEPRREPKPKATGKQSPKKDGTKLTQAWLDENTDAMKQVYFGKMRENELKATEQRWSYIRGDFIEHWINSATNAAKFKKKDWLGTWENQVEKQINFNKLKWKAEESSRASANDGSKSKLGSLDDDYTKYVDWDRVFKGEG